jgi:two-component system NtrC family sensor kinase
MPGRDAYLDGLLGLSISHDIIVKQHGGSIEVDTQPGEFTEFRIVLPRAAVSASK